ncbi:TPA: hypothetical protein ACPYB4_002020, partial [Streptococcus pneumoniae]
QKRKDEICPFSSLAFLQPTTVDKEPKEPDSSFCLYSMKIKKQTRKLATGCSKHCFEVVDTTHIYTARQR